MTAKESVLPALSAIWFPGLCLAAAYLNGMGLPLSSEAQKLVRPLKPWSVDKMYPSEMSSQHRLPPVLLRGPQDGQSPPILVGKRGLWFRAPGFTPKGCVVIGNPFRFQFPY